MVAGRSTHVWEGGLRMPIPSKRATMGPGPFLRRVRNRKNKYLEEEMLLRRGKAFQARLGAAGLARRRLGLDPFGPFSHVGRRSWQKETRLRNMFWSVGCRSRRSLQLDSNHGNSTLG